MNWKRYERLMGQESLIYALLEKVAMYESDDDDDIFPVEGLAVFSDAKSSATGYVQVGSGYADDSSWSFYPFLFYLKEDGESDAGFVSVEISLRELIQERGADAVSEALMDVLEFV